MYLSHHAKFCVVNFLLHKLQERRDKIGPGHVSGNIDFWTDPHRHECFGAFIVDITAKKYKMKNGLELFISDATKEALDDDIFVTGSKPILLNLEYPLNFEHFTKAKTCENGTDAAKIATDDIHQLAADGGSNAIGSVQEYEVVARDEGRAVSTDFGICMSHQNERSGGLASGTIKFAEMQNEELGLIIKKNHENQVRLNRSGHRLGVYSGVQDRKERNPKLGADPCGGTRWQGM